MPEEFDFSELRNYLQGQVDLGDAELLLDEPWALVRKKAAPVAPRIPVPPPMSRPVERSFERPAAPVASAPAFASPASSNASASVASAPNLFAMPNAPAAPAQQSAPQQESLFAPAPRPVKKTVSAYESAQTLSEFYANLKSDSLYAQTSSIACYEGPEHPQLLLLLAAPKPGEVGNFFQSPTGSMLVRLFESLNIGADRLGVTYFFKDLPRPLSPILLASLRKMLSKELSFVNPEMMIVFGEPLFYQVFGKGKNFQDMAGTVLDFNGVKAIPLVDAYAMSQDKQLKWLTWKVHIPRSGLFTVKK